MGHSKGELGFHQVIANERSGLQYLMSWPKDPTKAAPFNGPNSNTTSAPFCSQSDISLTSTDCFNKDLEKVTRSDKWQVSKHQLPNTYGHLIYFSMFPGSFSFLIYTRSQTLDPGLSLERIDQSTRTGIVACILPTLIKLSLDLLCQGLTQLYTPLVETVDVPYSSFGEGEVLIVCYQRSKRTWCDLLGKDRCRRSVAEEGLVGNQILWSSFGFDLLWRLTNHQRFSLSEEI